MTLPASIWHRSWLSVIIGLAFGGTANAQWIEMWSSPAEPNFIRIDNIHHLYAVDDNEIIKFDDRGRELYRFSNKQYGTIGDLDVSYPLRPLVFYPDLGTLLLLDNTLSEYRGPIDLADKGLARPILACASVQNHFWVYDQIGSKLVRMSDRFEKTVETGNLAQIFGVALEPNFIREADGRVYLNDPELGVLMFDLFGTYIKTIPLRNLEHFNPGANRIIYAKEDTLYRYDFRTHGAETTPLPRECTYVVVSVPHAGGICGTTVRFWTWTQP